MDDRQYQEMVDEFFLSVEDRIDELELDVDIDSSGGILSIDCNNGTSIILSRQPANQEIWVAARSGGFHCHYDGANWQCDSTGEDLPTLLNRVFGEQLSISESIF